MSSVRSASPPQRSWGGAPQGRRGHIGVDRKRLTPPAPSSDKWGHLPSFAGEEVEQVLAGVVAARNDGTRDYPRPARLPQSLRSRCVALSQCDGRNAMNRPDAFVRRCKRHFVRWLLAAAALLASAGMVQAETVLRIVMNSDLKILDPIWNTAFVIRDHGYMVYDTLFATDAEGEIRPQMVDRTEVSADKLTYTFTLRDGLLWHDGQPVTAEDCVASIKRWAARDTVGQKLMTFVLAVEARDP